MRAMRVFNPEKTEKRLVQGIKKYFVGQGKSKAVLGLSGGIDSAVVLALLVKALGRESVTAIIMPNSAVTSQCNTEDAKTLAEALGVKHFILPIDPVIKPFEVLPWGQNSIAKANLGARARMMALYNYANSNNCLVAGTGNKSEFMMGYFTKHGDGAADFSPIAGLFKKEVRSLAVQLGLPKVFLEKAPSAELWRGQTDEDEMGITYDELDSVLSLLLSKKKIPRGKESVARKIIRHMKVTEHKRKNPAAISVD